MSAVVRSLFRTTTNDAPTGHPEPLDYCQCGRGVVIGIVSCTATRLSFHSLEDWYTQSGHSEPADLRCVDCLTDTALEVATGAVRERMRESVRQRAVEMEALTRQNQMRQDVGLPIVPGIVPEGGYEWPTGGQR